MKWKNELKTTFGKTSKLYHNARREYLKKIFLDIEKLSYIKKGAFVLDLGCGSGKSTEFFIKNDYDVVGLDLGRSLINIARKEFKKYSNVKFATKSFEKSNFDSESFDLIISGQAFHWFDLDISFSKIYTLLKKGGHFAIFAKFIGNKETSFGKKIRKLFIKHCPNYPGGVNAEKYSGKYAREFFKRRKYFEKPVIKNYMQKVYFSKEENKNLLMSMSWVVNLSDKKRKLFSNDLDSLFEKQKWPMLIPYESVLLISKVKK